MNKYGTTTRPEAVILADHDAMFSAKDYFADKPEYTTFKTREEAEAAFFKAVDQTFQENAEAPVLYGYQYDGDDTVFIAASLTQVEGFTYPEFAENSYKNARTFALVERGSNQKKNRIAAEM